MLFDTCITVFNYLIIPIGILAVILVIYMVRRRTKCHKNEFQEDK